MGFELDKHDLFRNGVPGFIFLFVTFSFYLFAHQFIFDAKDNFSLYLNIMVIAITLPIGYLIHNIYRAFHAFSNEQSEWEDFEAKRIRKIINDKKLKGLEKEPICKEAKLLSWFLEVILYEKSNKSIRNRGYILISRVHSAGSAMTAILLGVLFSLWYYIFIKSDYICICNLFAFSTIWIIVFFCLWKARDSAIEGYQHMIKIFINMNEVKIKLIANKEKHEE